MDNTNRWRGETETVQKFKFTEEEEEGKALTTYRVGITEPETWPEIQRNVATKAKTTADWSGDSVRRDCTKRKKEWGNRTWKMELEPRREKQKRGSKWQDLD